MSPATELDNPHHASPLQKLVAILMELSGRFGDDFLEFIDQRVGSPTLRPRASRGTSVEQIPLLALEEP